MTPRDIGLIVTCALRWSAAYERRYEHLASVERSLDERERELFKACTRSRPPRPMWRQLVDRLLAAIRATGERWISSTPRDAIVNTALGWAAAHERRCASVTPELKRQHRAAVRAARRALAKACEQARGEKAGIPAFSPRLNFQPSMLREERS